MRLIDADKCPCNDCVPPLGDSRGCSIFPCREFSEWYKNTAYDEDYSCGDSSVLFNGLRGRVMTYVEAIKHTEMFLNIYDLFNDDKMAIKTLIEATERQIPKKPVWQNEDAGYYYDTGEGWSCICPTCGKYIDEDEHHCKCGQAINWSGVE